MKIKRYKHARRYLGFYRNVFEFREPHLVVVDGTFTNVALHHQTDIKEQLPKYLDGEVQLLTTKCAVTETESLGSKLHGAAVILKRYKMLNCTHHGEAIPAADCFKTIVGERNAHHYYIATQDPELTRHVRSIAGTPLLYMNMNAVILEKPSAASYHYSQQQTQEKLRPSAFEKETLKRLRGEDEAGSSSVGKRRRRRRPKEPNPLSVKKKKKTTTLPVGGQKEGEKTGVKRRKRGRGRRSKKLPSDRPDVTVS